MNFSGLFLLATRTWSSFMIKDELYGKEMIVKLPETRSIFYVLV